MRFATLSALMTIVAITAAHPGHNLSAEIAEHAAFKQNGRRTDLSHCSEKLSARGVEERNLAYCSQDFHTCLHQRDVNSVLAIYHKTIPLCYPKVITESRRLG
ncbi:Extracellular dioxygenase [Pyrenophora teres f. maculata]|nr:Extracellular dioxygenase [Pyrenophora teres f. maculata]